MPWVWELAALARRYDQCMEDGDTGWPDDLGTIRCFIAGGGWQ